jgi:hypothetical protein
MKNILIASALAAILAAFLLAPAALAHSWYSEKKDPVTHRGCCGDYDCSMWKIEPGALTAEADGYRVRLTEEQARRIRPDTKGGPIDALVIWDRVQPSEDGNWHLCITEYRRDQAFETAPGGIWCLFAPPNI